MRRLRWRSSGKHFTCRLFPCMEELLYNVLGSNGILNSLLLLIQEVRLLLSDMVVDCLARLSFGARSGTSWMPLGVRSDTAGFDMIDVRGEIRHG
ncbi:hypothetical protein LguiA_017781 [Lonicera macranthoides]